jgi:(E)-4-hydroxy-3-methylbut-2-enyl-diphosphate synthase
MTKTDTRDVSATLLQIRELEASGCDIIRLAVPDSVAAEALKKIRSQTSAPLVADIHFDHNLALSALAAGVDGLRLNPGNIGSPGKVKEVVAAARERQVPIRIGVNAGSLAPHIREQYGSTPQAMVASALEHIRLLEDNSFEQIKVSLKSSSVNMTIEAYRLLAQEVDYPFHLGVTEAGTLLPGTVKSTLGIGILLYQGMGDTIRVSLTGDPVQEVRVGQLLLRSLGLGGRGVEVISCPTCGRCQFPVQQIAGDIEERFGHLPQPLTIAVMGCPVNGPGEAREADIGVTGGPKGALLFKHGRVLKTVAPDQVLEAISEEIERVLGGKR